MDNDPDNYWIDMTYMGSNYEIQTNTLTGQHRHRPIAARIPLNRMMGAEDKYPRPDLPWKSGKPPEGK